MHLTGIHHLTAVTANAPENHAFYTRTLGMRLVKKTVNQDDVSAYHLFYADGARLAGHRPHLLRLAGRARATRHATASSARGCGSRARTRCVVEAAVRGAGVAHGAIVERDGRLTLDVEDFEGQRLSLVDDGGAGEAHPWTEKPGPARASDPRPRADHAERARPCADRPACSPRSWACAARAIIPTARRTVHVYDMGEGGPAAELHVKVEPDLPRAQPGAGGVHHVAFRTPNDDTYQACAERLRALRVPSSGPVDRFYFKSLYFREPNGILFEIATDGPGFSADEPLETLGERLSLPPFLEPRRADIEANLKAL